MEKERKSLIKVYFVLGLCCIAYYTLAAFAWEHFLAILITSGVWVLIWYFATIKINRLLVEQNDSIEFWKLDSIRQTKYADDTSSKLNYCTLQKKLMERDYNKVKKELDSLLKHTTNTQTTNARDNGEINNDLPVSHKEAVIELNVPQTEASKKLGAKVHNKIELDTKNYDHE